MPESVPNPDAYSTITPEHRESVFDTNRYDSRHGPLDDIVAAAEAHYWDPDDPRYVDVSAPFDLKEQLLLSSEFTPEIRTAAIDRIGAERRIEFANEIARFHISQLLHAEQGGVLLCGQLCMLFRDPAAQEYAANQVREESRHVRALSKYVGRRWGAPGPVGKRTADLMTGVLATPEIYRKIVGMQIMIEGLALGIFAAMRTSCADPVLARVLQLIMTDEAYHHRFGKSWGLEVIPALSDEQHRQVEDWAAGCFMTVAQNLVGAEQKQEVYERFGLDWKWVQGAISEAMRDPIARREIAGANRMFRVLVKTLLDTGIVTGRTKPLYQTWFDLDELSADSGGDESDVIAARTMAELSEINASRRRSGWMR